MNPKTEAANAIAQAQAELDAALVRLAEVPSVSADRLTYAAHALNNYLMVVSTIAHIVRASYRKWSEADVVARLDSLTHATTLMRQMVRQLVVPENEETHLIFLPVDLLEGAKALCDEYEPIAAKKGITIRRELPEEHLVVRTDRIALGAVLDNIGSNAVKYSKIGGTITVRLYVSGGEGILAVTDSGPGIPAGEEDKVFVRRGRTSSRPTGGESSTGYGLAIARDLTEALRGRIWFENSPGGGATFFLALPL